MDKDTIYRQDAINAIVKLTNCNTPEDLREYVAEHGLWSLWSGGVLEALEAVEGLPSAHPERLTDDDFETIRIHLNAYKEKLCNQRRWEEAEEYQRIIDRFLAFASAQPESCGDVISKEYLKEHIEACWINGRPRYAPELNELLSWIDDVPSAQLERKKGKWIVTSEFSDCYYAKCNQCNVTQIFYYGKPLTNFCPNCGADMREGE